ncbi:conodipine-P2-like [Mytilus trossulus]|uniref:conodipine-P2-like n=1 Tax=Mytilus trossulus TaxID=6551 RepID=UPI003004FDAA
MCLYIKDNTVIFTKKMDMNFVRLVAVILSILSCLRPIITAESKHCFQTNKGLSNGCSIPLFKKFPYKEDFTPSCQRHDICYNCAVKFSKSRKYCDSLFLDDMKKVCNSITDLRKIACKGFARLYHRAIRVGGRLFFEKTAKSECSQTWVRSCFP